MSADVVSRVMLCTALSCNYDIMEPECWTRTHSQLALMCDQFTLSCTEISTTASLSHALRVLSARVFSFHFPEQDEVSKSLSAVRLGL